LLHFKFDLGHFPDELLDLTSIISRVNRRQPNNDVSFVALDDVLTVCRDHELLFAQFSARFYDFNCGHLTQHKPVHVVILELIEKVSGRLQNLLCQ